LINNINAISLADGDDLQIGQIEKKNETSTEVHINA